MSGSGLVAPCGMLFGKNYKKYYHIGNIVNTHFKDIWKSDRYWKVMDLITSDKFDAGTDCGSLCLQHKVNDFLWDLKKVDIGIDEIEFPSDKPEHINFV